MTEQSKTIPPSINSGPAPVEGSYVEVSKIDTIPPKVLVRADRIIRREVWICGFWVKTRETSCYGMPHVEPERDSKKK